MTIHDANLKHNGNWTHRSGTSEIILHHAEASHASVEDVNQWHLNNGWAGIGYNYYIRKDGTIWRGRPEWAVGAHAIGHNDKSIGICCEGAYMTETMPAAQMAALKELIRTMMAKHPGAKLLRHCDVNSTDCPGRNFPWVEVQKYAEPDTAKRLKDCGELSGQNDADTLTEPGFYRGGDTSKMLLHAPIFSYAWTLEVLANSAWNVGVTQRFIDYETRRMYIRANHTIESGWVWYDWMEVAQCVVPEVHDLPLANGWLTYGTSINWYSKDQFGQVTIYFRLKSTVTTITDSITIANIPEGFRPQHGMSIPGLLTFDNYTRLPCHVDIVPSGALQLYVDGTAPSGRSVIELTCAEFHYPAK